LQPRDAAPAGLVIGKAIGGIFQRFIEGDEALEDPVYNL